MSVGIRLFKESPLTYVGISDENNLVLLTPLEFACSVHSGAHVVKYLVIDDVKTPLNFSMSCKQCADCCNEFEGFGE